MEGPMRLPFARSEGLVIEELADELLVYDLDVDRVHCLSPVAARVWRACDGETPIATLAGELGLEVGEVDRAIDELDRCDFLVAPQINDGYSRRDFGFRVTKIAAATASVPLIVSIVAPTAAHAQSPSACFNLNVNFVGSCGICNDGGTPTACCCCHGGGKGNPPIGCAADAAECCSSGLFTNPSHCTEQGGMPIGC